MPSAVEIAVLNTRPSMFVSYAAVTVFVLFLCVNELYNYNTIKYINNILISIKQLHQNTKKTTFFGIRVNLNLFLCVICLQKLPYYVERPDPKAKIAESCGVIPGLDSENKMRNYTRYFKENIAH